MDYPRKKLLASTAVILISLSAVAAFFSGDERGRQHRNVEFGIEIVSTPSTVQRAETADAAFTVERVVMENSDNRKVVDVDERVELADLSSDISLGEFEVPYRTYSNITLSITDLEGEVAGSELVQGTPIVNEGSFLFNSTDPEHRFGIGLVREGGVAQLVNFQEGGS